VGAPVSYGVKVRYLAELKWIKNLQTPFRFGLNDNIFQQDNISKDPNIDIFSILNIRKRKSRSHGVRRNDNLKRKSKITLSVNYLNIILKNSGKHAILSRLTSLSLSSLKILKAEADNMVIQTDPLNTAAYPIQSYTRHILRPHMDKTSDHDRHSLKVTLLNKGIDFIDLPSIFS
jgi:hypothetical protein